MSLKMLRIFRIPILSKCKNYLNLTNNRSLSIIEVNKLHFSTNNNNSLNPEPKTIKDIIKHWSHKFENEGISEPVESIEHILAHVLGTNKYRHKLLQIMELADEPDRRLSNEQINKLESLCDCRMCRMPVQYIIGEWDFRDITLKMVPPVFIPRPETEILVDIILRRVAERKNDVCQILDIGCGSGAISLALVHANQKIRCTSIDKSLHACDLTRQNAEMLSLRDNLKIVNAVLRENGEIKYVKSVESAEEFQGEQFDVIVSNPPYIPTEKLVELAPEIRVYEDLRALDGGRDGLNLVKALMKYASKALIPGGLIFMEVDPIHPEYIEFFTKKYLHYNLRLEHTYKDYCNNDRFVELLKLK